MEDPWASPWTRDAPAPLSIHLPPDQRQAHVRQFPREASRSPLPWSCEEEDGDVNAWQVYYDLTKAEENAASGKSGPRSTSLDSAYTNMAMVGVCEPQEASQDRTIAKCGESAISTGVEEPPEVMIGEYSVQEAVQERQKSHHASDDRQDSLPVKCSSKVIEKLTALPVHDSEVQELVDRRSDACEAILIDESDGIGAPIAGDLVDALNERAHDPPFKSEEKQPERAAVPAGDDSNQDDWSAACRDVPLAQDVTIPIQSREMDDENQNSSRPVRCHPPDSSLISLSTPGIVETATLDDLFPGVSPLAALPEQMPESVITNNFLTVSQRKTWYRLSRPGSMRRHEMGDDDNYVRVSWHEAHIRRDTLVIVRRWLEEGSPGPRKGSGRAGKSIFNWDSDAPVVGISQLLAAERSERSNLAASQDSKSSTTETASFRGASTAPSSPLAPITVVSAEAHGKPIPSAKMTAACGLEPAPKSSTSEDGDDWGEMVSTSMVEGSTMTVEADAPPAEFDAQATLWRPAFPCPPFAETVSADSHYQSALAYISHSPAHTPTDFPKVSQNTVDESMERIFIDLPDLSYMLK